MHKALFSSNNDEWETPQYIYDMLNDEFKFDIDVAASYENRKCKEYFCTSEDGQIESGLDRKWYGDVWCNPPYSKGLQSKFIEKAYQEYIAGNTKSIVMLLPARTDTKAFHNYIYNIADIRFIQGRLKFEINGVASKNSAPFPSMIVIYK